MAATAFDALWDDVRHLSPDELRRLRSLIDALLANPGLQANELSSQQQMDLAMLKSGLLSRVPSPPSEETVKAFQDCKPIPIEGEPLSETIIKERR
jgi:hypothetical protein